MEEEGSSFLDILVRASHSMENEGFSFYVDFHELPSEMQRELEDLPAEKVKDRYFHLSESESSFLRERNELQVELFELQEIPLGFTRSLCSSKATFLR